MGEAVPGPRKGALAFIFVTIVLDMLALGVTIPVLPKLILGFKGGDTASAAAIYGIFGTIFAAMQFFFAPLLGAVSDRFGRRPAILISNLALGLDYVLMAMAPTLAWLFVGRAISGICSASFSIPTAYIADVTTPEKRAAGFGMMGAAFGLGFILGPAFGGLFGNVDPRLPFWIAAGLSLANAAYGFFVLPESLPKDKRSPFHWGKANPIGSIYLLKKHAGLLSLTAVVFLSYLAHEALPSVWVLYTDFRYHWDARTVGFALAAVGVFSAAVQGGLVGVVVKRLGERRSLLLGLACGATAFAVYGLAPTGLLFCAAIPFGALWGFAMPSSQALMSQRVDPGEQGRLQGSLAALRGISGMIGPGLFTFVFALFVGPKAPEPIPGAPFLLASALLIASLALAWAVARPAPAAPPGG